MSILRLYDGRDPARPFFIDRYGNLLHTDTLVLIQASKRINETPFTKKQRPIDTMEVENGAFFVLIMPATGF